MSAPDERLATLASRWRESQSAEHVAREALAEAAREAKAAGMSAYRISQVTGAAPDTVAKWLRK